MADEQNIVPPATPPKAARQKPPSRPQRWAEACAKVSAAIDDVETAMGAAADALSEIKSLQEEYQEWRDNLPENLAQSALGEKLSAVCDLDIPEEWDDTVSVSEMRGKIEEIESADLPRGFGKD